MTEPYDRPLGFPSLPVVDAADLRAATADLSPEQRTALIQLLEETVASTREEERTSAIGRVTRAAEAANEAGDDLDAAVLDARLAGVTWEQIGRAAGMTRQSAWKRWASPTDHEHDAAGAGGRCTFCGATS